MESDWIDYKCKSGQTIFIYNKVTGVHKWPPGFNNGSSEHSIMVGQTIEYKELHSIATQTDDYGCNNGCTSMYINTDPHHISNIEEALPQPQQGAASDGEDDFENDEGNTLEDKDEQEQRQDMDEISMMLRVLEEMEFPPGKNLVKQEKIANDDSPVDDNAEKRQLHKTQGFSGQHSENSLKFPYCAKQFVNKSSLNIHCVTHIGKKPFECSYCKKTFTRKANLHRHFRIHTGEKPFECSYCKKTFAFKGNLNTHLRIHTGEKPFECSYCKKTFAFKSNLNGHLRIHTGEKPFKCSYCKKKFIQISNLKLHVRIHTGE